MDPEGRQLGIKPLPEALTMARELDLDLVEVAPQANPPVCRIMDYGKFKFDAAQRAKESRRKASSVSIKEMKYRPKIGSGDFDTKTRQVARFLDEGHKVKITIMFRGREVYHPELGKKILDRVAEETNGAAKVEAAPRLDGRNMIMVLAPEKRPHGPGGHGNPAHGGPAESTSADGNGPHNSGSHGAPKSSQPAARSDAGADAGAGRAEQGADRRADAASRAESLVGSGEAPTAKSGEAPTDQQAAGGTGQTDERSPQGGDATA